MQFDPSLVSRVFDKAVLRH